MIIEGCADTRQQKKPYSRPLTTSKRLQCYNYCGEHLRRDFTRPASSTGGAVALVSATYVSRLDTLHVSVLTENQLGVCQPRYLLEIGPEHRGVCSP